MSNVYTSIDQLIGHTPLLELTHFEADEDLKARVLVKLEYFNPAGSVKDRVAKNMIVGPATSSRPNIARSFSKLSSLRQCSMWQPSCDATSAETPASSSSPTKKQ